MFCSRALAVALVVLAVFPSAARAQEPSPSSVEELEAEKLSQEIRQLRLENDRNEGWSGGFLALAPFITIIVGLLAVVVPVTLEVRQQRHQRAAELEQRRVEEEQRQHQRAAELEQRRVEEEQRQHQRAAELEQRRVEDRRRFDELFARAVADLGSANVSVQVSAAIALRSFLGPEYEQFHRQIHLVLCGNLAAEHPPLVNKFIVRAFEISVRLHLEARRREGDFSPLDLANCQLSRVDLHELDLGEEVDIAFAVLKDANLRGTILPRARGYEVSLERAHVSNANLRAARLRGAVCRGARFHNADLMDTHFRRTPGRRADLSLAEFYGAKLQGAHFDDAELSGAKFDDANVTETYFYGAVLDDEALRSLLASKKVRGTPTWKRAFFDEAVTQRLERLAKHPSRRPRPKPDEPDGP